MTTCRCDEDVIHVHNSAHSSSSHLSLWSCHYLLLCLGLTFLRLAIQLKCPGYLEHEDTFQLVRSDMQQCAATVSSEIHKRNREREEPIWPAVPLYNLDSYCCIFLQLSEWLNLNAPC